MELRGGNCGAARRKLWNYAAETVEESMEGRGNEEYMNQTTDITYCEFNPGQPGPYGQYLLPYIAARAKWQADRYIVVGAAWNNYAAGAAAITLVEKGEAELKSLYVDPQARGHGIGTGLLRRAAAAAAKLGADTLTIAYTLGSGELEAMDRIVRAVGGEPSFHANVYTLDSAKFHDSPVFGWTLTPAYRPAANVVSFRDLKREQIDRLDENNAIPEGLRPAERKDIYDPALSLAWVEDGEVVSFLLTCRSLPGSYAALSGWRADSAPGDAYVHLLAACANLCFYDAGGDFLYHLSPISDRSEALVHAYVGDLCTKIEEHTAELRLPVDEQDK